MPIASIKTEASAFGAVLRRHRAARGVSQERLARDAEISTRHLSCLETGRAAPSKTMVLVLGSALDLPLRERNALLEAAGFVAAYRDLPLEAPEAAALRRAIDLMLDGIEPNGAIACDRTWNLLQMNQAATRLFAAFVDLAAAPPEVMRNVLVATLHPLGLRPAIVNFTEVAAMALDRARREAAAFSDDPEVARIRAAVAAIPDLPAPETPRGAEGPFITVHLRRNGVEARLFTTIATIGTPTDATAEDIRIETYFPADEATAAWMRALARPA
ncbi:MAG: helix-turn-helix transcriptional regulator [Labilithrix sp.]|nr:helix-turn-helix transcriptional regulator [Labilithrix sp.]MBX3222817.1 helix-turn-helix transcriptional regulator [Labilithrix sp.]